MKKYHLNYHLFLLSVFVIVLLEIFKYKQHFVFPRCYILTSLPVLFKARFIVLKPKRKLASVLDFNLHCGEQHRGWKTSGKMEK